MYCPQCRKLKDDLTRAQERHDTAANRLGFGQRGTETEMVLRLEITEARLYLDMAQMEVTRHEVLTHGGREVPAAAGN